MRSLVKQLLVQAQDAALTAVQVFNNPLIRFKSESFIVLMNIAWTYMLHAHYRATGVEYRYHKGQGKGRRYDRTPDGSYRYWDLRKCLAVNECPLDEDTKTNLRFLIGLRDEITHHISPALDSFVSARYQACSLNFNREIRRIFGEQHGIDRHLSFSIQFTHLSREQFSTRADAVLPSNLASYIARFDEGLSQDQLNSERFAFRVLFVPKLVGKAGQADEVVEFVRADSELAQSVNREYVIIKEVERPKYLPGDIVKMMRSEGFTRFSMATHTRLWQARDAKNWAKGYGVSIAKSWYWYESWLNIVRRYCEENSARLK